MTGQIMCRALWEWQFESPQLHLGGRYLEPFTIVVVCFQKKSSRWLYFGLVKKHHATVQPRCYFWGHSNSGWSASMEVFRLFEKKGLIPMLKQLLLSCQFREELCRILIVLNKLSITYSIVAEDTHSYHDIGWSNPALLFANSLDRNW